MQPYNQNNLLNQPAGFQIHKALVNGYNYTSSSLSSLKGRSVELLTNAYYGICATPKAPIAFSVTTTSVTAFATVVGCSLLSNVTRYDPLIVVAIVTTITGLAAAATISQSISLFNRIITAGKDAQLTADEKRVKYTNPELYAEYVLVQSQLKKYA